MNNFERITTSPEALGDFLGALPILSGPWDDDFHRVFCDSCDAENCDAENCAHQAERNSPTWWLKRAYTGSGPVKTDSTNPYKRQAADLRLEAMHQRDRFGRNLLATELEEAAAISRWTSWARRSPPIMQPRSTNTPHRPHSTISRTPCSWATLSKFAQRTGACRNLWEWRRPPMAEIILTGDALEQLRHLPPESVHTCVTSPPYYNLRDYGAAGQIGNEASVEEYLQSLVSVFHEVRRVLRADGTLWVNMGDSYATRSGSQPPTNTRNSCGHTAKHTPRGYKYKDLIGVPWQLAFALRADGWYLRQDIIWNKSNCMPESVRDRCTKSHEYIFLLSKSERYYFDAAAISEPVTSTKGNARTFRGGGAYTGGRAHDNSAQVERESHGNRENQTGRRNKRDVWTVSTNGFRGAHFAVFPEKLIEPCILAGSPLGGTVLDPFAGSGTTGVVAKRLRRDFIGCEINHDYAQMAADRIAAATP